MMKKYLANSIGRLQILAFLEGLSLLLLVFIAVPLKYIYEAPLFAQALGPIHGGLFILFVINTLKVSIELQWKFKVITWKVLIACLIPFGTFYIEKNILRELNKN